MTRTWRSRREGGTATRSNPGPPRKKKEKEKKLCSLAISRRRFSFFNSTSTSAAAAQPRQPRDRAVDDRGHRGWKGRIRRPPPQQTSGGGDLAAAPPEAAAARVPLLHGPPFGGRRQLPAPLLGVPRNQPLRQLVQLRPALQPAPHLRGPLPARCFELGVGGSGLIGFQKPRGHHRVDPLLIAGASTLRTHATKKDGTKGN